MSIVEYLISSPAGLGAPGGASFPEKSPSRAEDQKAWDDLMPALMTEMMMGRYIMAVIQVRAKTDLKWDAQARNFYGFNPAEDCILAAYGVSASIGSPYRAGLCSEDWVKNLIAQGQTGLKPGDAMKTANRGTTDFFQVFQCSPHGFKLALIGTTALMKMYQTSGPPQVDARSGTTRDMTRPDRWGWRGGAFPALKNRAPAQWARAVPRR